MSYEVRIKPSAEKTILRLHPEARRRILGKLAELESTPRPQGVQRLRGGEGELRVRIGDYRIVYLLNDAQRVLYVTKVGHRSEVYR